MWAQHIVHHRNEGTTDRVNCAPLPRTRRKVTIRAPLDVLAEKGVVLLGALSGGGAAGRRGDGRVVVGVRGRRPGDEGGCRGVGRSRGPRAATLREFRFHFGSGRRRRGRPEGLRLGTGGVNPKALQAPRAGLHVSPRR